MQDLKNVGQQTLLVNLTLNLNLRKAIIEPVKVIAPNVSNDISIKLAILIFLNLD